MLNKLIFTVGQELRIREIMEASYPAEQGVFCLVSEYESSNALIKEIIEVPSEAWAAQGEHYLTPTTQWLSVVASKAHTASSGLLFMHSHPNAQHPPGLSPIDRRTSESLARTVGSIIDGPFLSGVVHAAGWHIEQWEGEQFTELTKIISVGQKLSLLNTIASENNDLDSRQQSALGVINGVLKRLVVAVVGCGGIGSQVAVQLARMGVGTIVLIDNDVIDTQSNVRRMSGTKLSDFNSVNPKAKVDTLGDYIDSLGLGTEVYRVQADVRSSEVIRQLQSVDVVMSCTDNHSSRAALNFLPFNSKVPIIDAGTRVSSKMNGELAGLWSEIRAITPVSVCLNCRGVIDPKMVAAENLPEHIREQSLRDGYVTGEAGAQPEPSVLALTSYAASHAIAALVAMLSLVDSPDWYSVEALTSEVIPKAAPTSKASCICAVGSLSTGQNHDRSYID